VKLLNQEQVNYKIIDWYC